MKRLIAFFVMTAMLVSVLCGLGVSAEPVTPTADWYNESATELIIDSVEDFAAFDAAMDVANEENAKDFTGKTVKLAIDIDATNVSWSGQGRFRGTFDGQNHIIENISIDTTKSNTGMFGWAEGTISNFTLKNITIESTVGLIGAVVGRRPNTGEGNKNLTIQNVHVTGANISGTANIGGIIGATNGESGNTGSVTISNCSFSGSLTGSADDSRVGGIIGYGINTGSIIINDCSVDATVSGVKYVGGLVADSNAVPLDIDDCNVNAAIINTNNSGAGMIGQLTAANADIDNSYVSVSISGAGNHKGGIIGRLVERTVAAKTVSIDNVFVTGSINSSADIAFISGMIAWINADNASYPLTLNMNNVLSAVSSDHANFKTGVVSHTSTQAGLTYTFADVYADSTLSDKPTTSINGAVAASTGTVTAKTTAEIKALNLTGWVTPIAGEYPIPAALFTLKVIGYQTKANANNTYDVRFVIGIKHPELANFENVGATVEVAANSKSADATTTSLYTSVTGAGETYTAAEENVDALYIIAISGIADATTFTAEVTPFINVNTNTGTASNFADISKTSGNP